MDSVSKNQVFRYTVIKIICRRYFQPPVFIIYQVIFMFTSAMKAT